MRLSILSFVIVLVVAAFVAERPPDPPVVAGRTLQANVAVPEHVEEMLRRACFDCHSSETRWPWYASVPPVSYLIHRDVDRGRTALNFSEWSTGVGRTPGRGAGTLSAICAAVELHKMPKPPYPYLHPEARLSAADVQSLCAWTREVGAQIRAGAKRP
jgi:hypothetical protein